MSLISEERAVADLPLWREAGVAAEIVNLHVSRVFYGAGVARGDGAAVILVPGFLLPDAYLAAMRSWLRRIGYKPRLSGIGINADCPNLLIRQHLNVTLEQALRGSGQPKVHLIGHSLGGVMARALAVERPNDVASVTTLASPFRGTAAHRTVLMAAEAVRHRIARRRGREVLPECYTGHCGCEFMQSLRREMPVGVVQTAIYTRSDGVVDWRYCITGDAQVDFEVRGTHMGLAFNAAVYELLARRLAEAGVGGK